MRTDIEEIISRKMSKVVSDIVFRTTLEIPSVPMPSDKEIMDRFKEPFIKKLMSMFGF